MLAAMFSALAFYAASPHCRWPRLRRAGRLGHQIGLVAAAAALWLWMAELGFAAGLVAMLCTGCSRRCCCRRWPPAPTGRGVALMWARAFAGIIVGFLLAAAVTGLLARFRRALGSERWYLP